MIIRREIHMIADSLREDEQKGWGSMVVCIDRQLLDAGRQGTWAKAMSLTLMDIARRQRWLFRAVLFLLGPRKPQRCSTSTTSAAISPNSTRCSRWPSTFPILIVRDSGGLWMTDFETPGT
jgi:hypothetical protein